jgi:hypothetical protein
MTYEEIRQKMIEYYENVDFVDKWMNTVSPNIDYKNHTPKQVFSLQNNQSVVKFGEDFAAWLDKQKTL